MQTLIKSTITCTLLCFRRCYCNCRGCCGKQGIGSCFGEYKCIQIKDNLFLDGMFDKGLLFHKLPTLVSDFTARAIS